MFSSKSIEAAQALLSGECAADVFSGYSASEMHDVVAVLQADGSDDVADEVFELACLASAIEQG